ncbi:uncharacterized protein OCT59_012655 [Rhizophagus irregularis]|uniref:Uncharacterized protein n=1 Tax=Rhizophagus irregularis (strain DAOM 181602 / DAOM 197198 / MUCL 43194) TaxID=747089 RepID=A0A2P4PVM3_RHIID|nr:hypothetical protein GLOIN_2v1480011 [Rhizophagus irregularis DAOM 181602=DAOM 197198]POG69447.1 hypothetical protein GLOIN_2v1480011 [Rhizophagus irregularis DAOM 181602=DAOM 197198]UZO20229.1 hypothetical protein OCT59_012655 [Rhizophagus irregularis]CAG8504469.1 21804_t:CDS:2 [Rhizophagus irregularis]|eukprot:XP_025176313.1 hypothetical protein GLOIN_2v1480011 [Rhizophagus irregularis DAOM 181602=DAOM 197198]
MNKSDKFVAEQFDINDEEWTINKCKQFLRFIQEKPTNTRIEMEKNDENHIFLPKYIKAVNENGKKFYEWKSEELDDIFEAIFQFLNKYYPDINKFQLQTNHDEKISEWKIKYPILKKLKSKKEADLQNDLIKEVNDKWLPGFKYLYNFEYQHAEYVGDLIFANDLGILVAVETKIIGYSPFQYKKVNEAEKQAINYRNILMDETKDKPEIITVIGCYFLKPSFLGNRKRFPLDIDRKIWNAIKKVNKSNKKSLDSDQQSVAPTTGEETLYNFEKGTEEQENEEIVKDFDKMNL